MKKTPLFVCAVLLASLSASASERADRICTPDALPSATDPQTELTRVFVRADAGPVGAHAMPPGAMEVVVARIGADGKVELSCVDSEAGARSFFDAKSVKQKREVVEK